MRLRESCIMPRVHHAQPEKHVLVSMICYGITKIYYSFYKFPLLEL